jgi:hypothetical protein
MTALMDRVAEVAVMANFSDAEKSTMIAALLGLSASTPVAAPTPAAPVAERSDCTALDRDAGYRRACADAAARTRDPCSASRASPPNSKRGPKNGG